MKLSFQLNGRAIEVDCEPADTLAEVLRNTLNLNGTKVSCEVQVCGACTVLVDGTPVSACTYLAYEARGKNVVTIEGLEKPDRTLDPIQQAFIDEGAAQCGFCLSGVILTAKAVLDKKPNASDQEIGEALGGVLCRCFTHLRMLRAIRKYAGARKA